MRLLSICVVGRLHNPISFVLFSCKSPFSGPTSLAFLKLEQAPASLTISSVAQILLCCVSMLPPSTKKYSFCLSLLISFFPPSYQSCVLRLPQPSSPLPEPGHAPAVPAALLSCLRQSGAASVAAIQTTHSTGWLIDALIRLVALQFWRLYIE